MADKRNMDTHPCPKCKSEMIKTDRTYSLVEYVPQGSRKKNKKQINPLNALPVDVYYCEYCRRVGLFAP